MTRSLIIVRAGHNSIHDGWLSQNPDRDWDLFICPYQETPFADSPGNGVFLGDVLPGQKWTGLRALLNKWVGWRDYDYIVLADDDIETTATNWSAFFAECRRLGANLAQPALSRDSYVDRIITSANGSFRSRRVTFVEIMIPCFKRDVLAEFLPTLALTETGFGFGLDFLWPHMLGNQDIFIFDSTAVRHTRPVGGDRNSDKQKAAWSEARSIIAKFGVTINIKTLSGIDHEGKELSAESIQFIHAYIKGYWHILDRRPHYLAQLLQYQLGVKGLKP